MSETLGNWHRRIGLIAVVVFLATGVSMRLHHVERIPEGAALHFIFRSRHIYMLFSGLLNIAVGLRYYVPAIGRGSKIGIVGSALLMLSPILMALGFFTGPLMTGEAGEFSRVGIYASLAGMVLYGLAAWPRSKLVS